METLQGLDGVEVFMDDILVYENSMEQHFVWLEKMMQHIQAVLKLNKAKILIEKEPAMVPGPSHQPVRGQT